MSKSKITGKVLSIQLGRKETQIVVVGKGNEILYGETVATPAGAVEDGVIRNPDAVRDMLKTALKTPEFKRVRQAVFSVCTSQVITETVNVPALPNAKLEKLLQANMDMYFPVDVQDYHLVWQLVGPRDGAGDAKEVTVQLWAVPIALLKRYYNVGNDCGLSVAAIDYCGHSIATAVGASFARSGKSGKKSILSQPITFGKKKTEETFTAAEPVRIADTELHVLMERELLGMTFVQNGQVVLQRCVRCGAQPSHQFGELSMMVEYFRSLEIGRGSEIRGVASGVLAADSYMIEELSDALGIPFSRLAVPYEIKWVLCAGAAHTDLDFGMPSMNAPGKSRRELQSQLWQYGMILGGALAVMAVVMMLLNARLDWELELRNLEGETQLLTARASQSNGYAENYYNYKSAYDAYSKDWDNTFLYLRSYNDNLVRALGELEEVLPETTSVLNMQIKARGLDVVFACENKEEAAYVIRTLRDMEYVDLLGVSNLEGGGNGPATSYGTKKTAAGEAPPTEGSTGNAAIMGEALQEGALATITLEQVDTLASLFGNVPSGDSSLITSSTEAKRREALDTMFDENPFALKMLMNLLEDNLLYLLTNGYYTDLSAAKGSSFSTSDIPVTLDGARDFKETYGFVLYQTYGTGTTPYNDSTRLKATESILMTDDDLASMYAYYLENGDAESYPYINESKITNHLKLYGDFNTGDATLNSILDGLITYTPETQPPTEETTQPTVAPTVEPEEPTVIPTIQPEEPTVTPTVKPEDPTTESTVNPTESTGETENTTAPTESTAATTAPTESTGATEDTNETTDATGDSTAATTDPTETTEAPLDFDSVTVIEVSSWLKQYLANNGTSESKEMDAQFTKYFTTGTTDYEAITEMIEQSIEGGVVDAELKLLIKDFWYSYLPNTGNPLYVALTMYRMNDGSSGISTILDTKIQQILNSIADDLLGEGWAGEGEEGAGQGQAQQNPEEVDTRIRFSVLLGYSDAMRNIELERKGLYYEDKIDERFVQTEKEAQ